MEIIDFGPTAGYSETRFGSVGLTVTPLVESVVNTVVLRVAPGGRIGRHPALGVQVFAVVNGSGTVSGGDGVVQPIVEGQAAIWQSGELHETRSAHGLTAVVSQGPELRSLLPLDDPKA